MGIIVREFIYCEYRKIGNILSLAEKMRRAKLNESFESKGNVSKAKIHPVTITDIEELPWLVNFSESVYLNLFIS